MSQPFLPHHKEYQLPVEAPIFLQFLGNHPCLFIRLTSLVTSTFFLLKNRANKYSIIFFAIYSFYYRKRDETTFQVVKTVIGSHRLDNLTASSQHIIYVTASNQNGESRPSETLVAWTDPAFEPVVEVPTVHPMNLVLENGSMTVICVAMGTPMPTISLYVSGELIKQEKTRHLVAVISNVTRSMNLITCYAENGYGQPSEASKRIVIGRMFFAL